MKKLYLILFGGYGLLQVVFVGLWGAGVFPVKSWVLFLPSIILVVALAGSLSPIFIEVCHRKLKGN